MKENNKKIKEANNVTEGGFTIGNIIGAHGIKGELKVFPTTDDVRRFDELNEVYISRSQHDITLMHVENRFYHKNLVVLKLKEVNDRNAAEALKHCSLRITEKQALPLKEDEYYFRDLYNLKVVTESGESLGELTDIIETGANDVYVVTGGEKEILIPAIKQCIVSINMDDRLMTVRLLEGLV